uniref:Transposase (Putative), gypsy type n=1 Tax=Tanacetum cinerariifolium TaxID=118510 RepID=A0A6L2KIX7_TANCI|nr:hypothetical protein [Tanacetum cinerariifolium]
MSGGIARLKFRYISVLPSSSAVTYASATFPCIGSITDIRSVLTQRALKKFCETFQIPDEVHSQLPNPNQKIHEMSTGKIAIRYCAAKVSHFEILYRVYGFELTIGLFRYFYVNSKNKGWMSFSKRQSSDAVCYTKPLDSLKGWNDHFFWIDAFACPALLLWHTGKSVSRDVIPKSSEFSSEDYATLVAYPAPFHKYLEPLLCLVGMSRNYTLDENTYPQFLRNDDKGGCSFLCFTYALPLLTMFAHHVFFCAEIDLLSFICTVNHTKVKIGERKRDEEEPKLLETTVGRVVPLLSFAPDRSAGELETSVEKLYGEGVSGEQAKQGDSASVGRGVGIDVVAETSVKNVAPAQLKRQKKRKTKVVDAGKDCAQNAQSPVPDRTLSPPFHSHPSPHAPVPYPSPMWQLGVTSLVRTCHQGSGISTH